MAIPYVSWNDATVSINGVPFPVTDVRCDAADDEDSEGAPTFTPTEMRIGASFILDGEGAQKFRDFLDRIAPKADWWKRWGCTHRVAKRRYATHARRARARLLACRGAHDWATQQVEVNQRRDAWNERMHAWARGDGEYPGDSW